MGDDMVSEAEFGEFQANLERLGQEIFEYKETLKKLKKENSGFEALQQQLDRLRGDREGMMTRHEQSLAVLREELEKKKREAEEQAEKTAREQNDRIAEVNQQIATLQQEIKEKEVAVDRLRIKVRGHDSNMQLKTARLQRLIRQEEGSLVILRFLEASRPIPMYIEDLSVRIERLRNVRDDKAGQLRELRAKLADLQKLNSDVETKLDNKTRELAATKRASDVTNDRLHAAEKEMESTRRALDDARDRLEGVRAQTEKIVAERREIEERAEKEKEELRAELARQEEKKAELAKELEAAKGGNSEEMAGYEAAIAKLRKKLTYIKDNDADPDVPRVDRDLQRQIDKVLAEMGDLEKDTEGCYAEAKRLDVQIKQKEWELQTLSMKMEPTKDILEMPEFAEKTILLEELVLQNMTLRAQFEELSERVVALKQENVDIRKKLGELTKKNC